MQFDSYKKFWNNQAKTPESAMFAVDGSTDESIVQRTGIFANRQLSAALDLRSTDRVLELGCGLGRIGRQMATECAHWTGVDISQSMIDHAQERLKDHDNVSLYALERSSLDMFDDDSFDKAYSMAVLCHMDKEDLFLYLEELARVVRPGGLIYADTWNLAHPTGWKRWQYEVRYWQKSDQSERKDIARNQFCTPDELRLYAKHAGLDVLRCFDDCHWLQLVAGVRPIDADEQRERLERVKKQVIYTPWFSELFEKTCEVLYGEIHPKEAIAHMNQHPDTEETKLFGPFIRSLWESNTTQWGAVDDQGGS